MKPVKRVPIVQQVEDAIREQIAAGTFLPNEKLPAEMELCQQLGVGRGTVREAFRLLQAKGFVEIRPGRGAFVAEPPTQSSPNVIEWFVENESELRSSLEVRAALEPTAARLMVARCDDETLHRLKDIHTRFLTAVVQNDAVLSAILDEQFHSTIVAASENPLLIRINVMVCEGVKTFRSKTFQVTQNAHNAIPPHTEILTAILNRDGIRAEDAMRRHLRRVEEDLSATIELRQ